VADTCTCAICGETFKFVEDAEDIAQAEWDKDFGDLPRDQQDIVCHSCYETHIEGYRRLNSYASDS
jgi:hypothetical protein